MMTFLIGIIVWGFYLFSSVEAQTKFTCRQVVFNCDCGNPGYIFQAHFKQCHYWLPPEQACTRFQHCLECENGVDTCVTCPQNRYGRLCKGVCQCSEGQKCNRDTGQCEGKGAAVQPDSCSPPTVQPPLEQKMESIQGVLKAIEYSCPDGYTLEGAKTIRCYGGKWDDDPPKCSTPPPEPCIPPNVDPRMEQKMEWSQGILVSIEYSCSEYSTLNGAKRITCKGGKWDNDPPNCKAKGCQRPEDISNGRIDEFILPSGTRIGGQGSGATQVFPVGTTAIYRCNAYYKLAYRGQKSCLDTGNWSGEQPKCLVECGVSEFKVPTIVGGSVTEPGNWPWQAALANLTNYIFCGGSLITDTWVITAAHCLIDESNVILSPSTLNVLLGKYDRNINDKHVQKRSALRFQIHPAFARSTFDSDIALIVLSAPIILSSRALPVCLTKESISHLNIEVGNSGMVTGWGRTETGNYADVLKTASLSIISNSECSRRHSEDSNQTFTVTVNMFCAGDPSGTTDICYGDSGGPMVFDYETADGNRWFLEGIVSWGSKRGCARRGLYSGFTKVVKFLFWIYSYVDDLP